MGRAHGLTSDGVLEADWVVRMHNTLVPLGVPVPFDGHAQPDAFEPVGLCVDIQGLAISL